MTFFVPDKELNAACARYEAQNCTT